MPDLERPVTGLLVRLAAAAESGRPCVVSPEEIRWLRQNFRLGDPGGEAALRQRIYETVGVAAEGTIQLVIRYPARHG